ncbi:hypothetical protein EVAR_14118_1 [Eumeta japonica]|uniref:Uncharacterized protein n=1 Tax=Eumeta variegata TaxID=151549 RepID=A0A4C1UPN8_EUMVA|nr:hypothetical protein EVAR_14118_1 [Eumeta japonica]
MLQVPRNTSRARTEPRTDPILITRHTGHDRALTVSLQSPTRTDSVLEYIHTGQKTITTSVLPPTSGPGVRERRPARAALPD